MPDWICPNCAAEVDDGFDVCWQCGATQAGETDPYFGREHDLGALPADYIQVVHCEACGYVGKVLYAHEPLRWWMILTNAALAPLIVVTGIFRIFAFDEEETRDTCPACGRHDALHNCDRTPDEKADRIWLEACQLDAMAVEANKARRLVALLVLLLVLVLLAVVMLATILAQ
jgi:hypothetical protein